MVFPTIYIGDFRLPRFGYRRVYLFSRLRSAARRRHRPEQAFRRHGKVQQSPGKFRRNRGTGWCRTSYKLVYQHYNPH